MYELRKQIKKGFVKKDKEKDLTFFTSKEMFTSLDTVFCGDKCRGFCSWDSWTFLFLFLFHYDCFSILSVGIKLSGFQYKLCTSLRVDCFYNCPTAILVGATLSSVMDLEEIQKFASEANNCVKTVLRGGICSGHVNLCFWWKRNSNEQFWERDCTIKRCKWFYGRG